MKSGFIKFIIVLLIVMAAGTASSQQHSKNTAADLERVIDLQELEKLHKNALERGDEKFAGEIAQRFTSLQPEAQTSSPSEVKDGIAYFKEAPQGNAPEYIFNSPKVYDGMLVNQSDYHKLIDMKAGEDGCLYLAAVWKNALYPSGIATYKSTNNGLTWNYLYGFLYSSSYIGNISLLVESKDNSVKDSTRLIIFYNFSSNANMDNASLNFASWRVNGTGVQNSVIANASSGNEIAHLSAVTDGAFYQSATYFGAVFVEANATMQAGLKVRYIRTVNWGSTWTQVTILTNTNDFRVTADLKRSSPDSVYIAVERRIDASNYQIKVIATPFAPSASFRTVDLTSGFYKYTNPCITIRQTSPSSSILLTCIRSGSLVYYISTNNGASWSFENTISNSSTKSVSFAHCSSSPGGSKPFAIAWSSMQGDSVNLTRSELTTLHSNIKNRINKTGSTFSGYSPVSAVTYSDFDNFGGVAYAGVSASSPKDIYFNGSGFATVAAKFILEGQYNLAQDKLNMSDTVTAILRKPVSPYEPIDTARAILNLDDYTAVFYFNKVIASSMYIVFKHRNTIETWISGSNFIGLNSNDSAYKNLSTYQGSVYAFNQKNLRPSPPRFGFFTGDVNQDGTVDASDLSMIDNDAVNFVSGYFATDLTGDNYTDATDYSLADNNASRYISVARP